MLLVSIPSLFLTKPPDVCKVKSIKLLSPSLYKNPDKLKIDDINFSDEIIEFIIKNYTDEEGVRDLKRCFEKIISKINILFLLDNNKEIELSYKLKNLIKPLNIDNKIVEILLSDNKIDDNISKLMMYL